MAEGQPNNLILQLLRDMRADIADVRADLRSEIHSLGANVASDLHQLDAKIDGTRNDLSEQIVGLRRAVVDYHSAVIGHGNIIAELEARLRRVEQRLGLDEH